MLTTSNEYVNDIIIQEIRKKIRLSCRYALVVSNNDPAGHKFGNAKVKALRVMQN